MAVARTDLRRWVVPWKNRSGYSPALILARRACFEKSSHARIGPLDCLDIALADREGCAPVTAGAQPQRSVPGQQVVLLRSL